MMTKYLKYLILLAVIPVSLHAKLLPDPSVNTSAIIEVYEAGQFQGIVLVAPTTAPFGKALPGGKLSYEPVENALRRLTLKQANLKLSDLRQFHVYNDYPHHAVNIAHIAKSNQLPNTPNAYLVKIEDIPWSELAFEHVHVLQDYIEWRKGKQSLSMAMP